MWSDWTGAEFLEDVVAWTTQRLTASGIVATGRWQQPHARPWSSTISFETDHGRVWFKVNGPGTLAEPRVTGWLSQVCPDLVVDVLAVDEERGWWLSRDAGPMLREQVSPEESWPAWEVLLGRYADLQIDVAGRRTEALTTGVREVTATEIPAATRALLTRLTAEPAAEGGLSPTEARSVEALLPTLDGWCAELEDSRIPDSIQHDDLHSGNVGWRGDAATARILDWGDASWGFPLSTMLSTTRSLAFHAGLEDDDPLVQRAVDAYLEPFTSYDDRAGLQRMLGLGLRTGCVGRALAWDAALQEVDVTGQAELDFPVRAWLLELLAD